MKILAIDPGKTTGYCKAELRGDTLHYLPFQELDDVDDFWLQLSRFNPRYIVCEDFEFRGGSRTGLVLFSVQLIGVARLFELRHSATCAMTLQKAAQGKGYFTNPMLRNLNVFEKGAAKEHAMDATRHLLHWLTFSSGYSLVQHLGRNLKYERDESL